MPKSTTLADDRRHLFPVLLAEACAKQVCGLVLSLLINNVLRIMRYPDQNRWVREVLRMQEVLILMDRPGICHDDLLKRDWSAW